jgi:uncharacterized protein YbgA (DUF1722 family)
MAIFKYIVVGSKGKKLSGSIEAQNENLARNELNNLGFSILELAEAKPEEELNKKNPNETKYVFEALNPQGQSTIGTITAINDISAFKRLTEEYSLTVTAIWPDGASEEQIKNAKIRGTLYLQQIINSEKENKLIEETKLSQEDRKKSLIVQTRVEEVLKQVNDLLKEYEQDISPDQKQEIDKRIDKLLRIKNSTNLDYIITTAEELLQFIQQQETELKNKDYLEKRANLKLKVKNLLSRLHDTGKPKTLSEDIVKNIQDWQQKYVTKTIRLPWYTRLTNSILTKIEKIFETPEEIRILKTQIKNYNSQIIEYIKIYFKEPTKEYKEKVKNAIKTIWQTRKNTIKQLKETKKRIKEQNTLSKKSSDTHKGDFLKSLWEELNEFTGWLLAFYLIYYFVSLYMTSKNFGLAAPKGLNFNNTHIFKYALAVIFILHTALSVKTNFFPKKLLASVIILPSTFFLIIFTLANF